MIVRLLRYRSPFWKSFHSYLLFEKLVCIDGLWLWNMSDKCPAPKSLYISRFRDIWVRFQNIWVLWLVCHQGILHESLQLCSRILAHFLQATSAFEPHKPHKWQSKSTKVVSVSCWYGHQGDVELDELGEMFEKILEIS